MVTLLVSLIRLYRLIISPFLGQICRFHPSCSRYAEGCLITHGLLLGTWLTVKRLSRCHPFHPGGHDPVPPKGFRTASCNHDHTSEKSSHLASNHEPSQHGSQKPPQFSALPLADEADSLLGQS